MLTGLVLGIGGWFLGAWIGGQMAVGHPYLQGTDQNDVGIYMGYLFAVIGWLVGLGFANYPIGRLLGRAPSLRHHETGSWTRYFRLCTDHKVVGIQYLFGVGRRGSRRDGRLRHVVHPDRDLPDARRPQSHGDDPDDARSGDELDAPADLRLVRAGDVDPDGAGRAGARRVDDDGADGPGGEHVLLRRERRRQPVPVREPLLVLWPSGGVHPRPTGVRDRARDTSGLRS